MYLRTGPSYPGILFDTKHKSGDTSNRSLGSVLISVGLFVVVISALLPCLGVIKRSLRCIFGRSKVKQAVRSKSVLSRESTYTMSEQNYSQ